MACIYALFTKSSPDEIRYVGRSKEASPDNRHKSHLRTAKNNKCFYHVYRWMRKVIRDGDEVLVVMLEQDLRYEETGARERYWIAYYRSLGHRLTNLTDGGEGQLGWKPSKETLINMGNATRGRTHSDEAKLKMSVGHMGNSYNIGRKMSDDTKSKLRVSSTGRTHSETTKMQMRKSKSEEHKQNISKGKKGRKLSEAHKQAIKESWNRRRLKTVTMI